VKNVKKISSFILLTILVFILSSCSLDYPKYDGEINGYQLYRYEEFGTKLFCDRISPWGVFIKYDGEYYITQTNFGNCSSTLYIKESSKYLTLTQALEQEILEIDDVLNREWDFTIYETYDVIGNISIEKIEVSNETNDDDSYTITDLEHISQVKMNWAFYELFVLEYDYRDEEVLGYVTIYDTVENVYHFEVRANGILYVEEDMFCEFYDTNFHQLLSEDFGE